MHPKVDSFIADLTKWQKEVEKLREIILDCLLTEDFKWRTPCYSFNGKNILLIGCFKNYCSVSFFKGVLLQDSQKLLVSPGENSQSVKYFKFENLEEIKGHEETIRAYIIEAIELEKAGVSVEKTQSNNIEICEELVLEFENNPAFKTAFNELSKGRQRGYALFFNSAKQPTTRTTRILKYQDKILKGFGIHDCTCGLSKKMPNCDGSHKSLG